MSYVSPMSAKTIAEIKSGKRDLNGRIKISAKELFARKDAMAQKIRDQIFGTGKPKRTRTEKQRAKDHAIEQFSMWIRLRDSDEHGTATCITCGARKFWRLVDAGHYVTCAKEATRFDENNVHAQCKGCNKWQGGKPVEYEVAIDRKYGPGTALKIREKSRINTKRLARHYQFIADTYKSRVDLIRTNSPSKFKH